MNSNFRLKTKHLQTGKKLFLLSFVFSVSFHETQIVNVFHFIQSLKRTKMLTVSGETDVRCLLAVYPLRNVFRDYIFNR